MNCHEDNNQKQSRHKGHVGHMLLMVLCCAIPIVLLLVMPTLQINNAFLKSILPIAVFLLCPLMHLLMMPMMMRKHKNGDDTRHDTMQIENKKGGI